VSADPVTAATSPWAGRRRRADELRDRHPFTGEVLTLYLALLPVQEEAWRAVRESAPPAAELALWTVARVLPAVVDVTAAAGPAALSEAVRERLAADEAEAALSAWLAGDELDPVDAYLARASLAPALEALGERAAAYAAVADHAGPAICPCCGGPPQLSVAADSGEALVTGRRSLHCARCATSWDYTRSTCPACGESDEDRLLVYAEQWSGAVSRNANGSGNGNGGAPAVFPNLRVVGCKSCHRYVIEVDMARDARAVPEVDELAALPLDLYAADQGLTKVTPNLMGF
jgi:formate dehydrogenase maturation protein FdhE